MLLFAVPTPGMLGCTASRWSYLFLLPSAPARARPRPLRAPRPPFRPPCGLPSPLQLIYTHPSPLADFSPPDRPPPVPASPAPAPPRPRPPLPSRSVHLDVALLSLAVAPLPVFSRSATRRAAAAAARHL
ncbi:hypothetical protein B0H11DRAFT_2256725 [Mycena galericulata]|nr:hypothetical protein B0H11DRAFT_2256725 [Mycena galericulata]